MKRLGIANLGLDTSKTRMAHIDRPGFFSVKTDFRAVAIGTGTFTAQFIKAVTLAVTFVSEFVGKSPGIEMGPLITAEHRAKVAGYVDQGVSAGAELVVDGRGYVNPDEPNGFFLGGCLFDRVTPDMTIYREEIFGPVLCVVRAGSYAEALELVDALDPETEALALDSAQSEIFWPIWRAPLASAWVNWAGSMSPSSGTGASSRAPMSP